MVTTSTVTALSLLSMDPSPAVVRSARDAAESRHGLVNLTRLVHSLDRHSEEQGGLTWLEVQKTWETLLYARALLSALQGANEQASTTASDLGKLELLLSRKESDVQAAARRTPAPAPPSGLPLFDLPAAFTADVTSPVALLDEAVPATLSLGAADAALPPDLMSPPLPKGPSSPILSPKLHSPVASPFTSTSINTNDYFAKRKREDEAGGEVGLLPLKTAKTRGGGDPTDAEGMRQRLLGGSKSGAIGSSQLHEELGGQLADMSHRLKLNAIHFSNSLEEEKTLLETSQDVLEKNLESTKSSKGQLSQVSRKGRGTTCMSLGIVIVVILLFIWTYMLIRFSP